jgi:hypothetical protein
VYWVEHAPDGIFRATLERSPATERIDTVSDALADPFDVAVEGSTLYVTNGPGNEVRSRPLGGGTSTTLFPGAGRSAYLAASSGRVYVTAFDPEAVGSGSVVRGPEPEIGSLLLYPDQPGSAGIAVATDGLYWGVGTRGDSPGAIVAAPLSGSGEPNERVTAEGPVFGVAVDETAVFWTTEDAVWRAARGDLKPALVYRHDSELGAGDVAITPSHVYVSAPRLRALLRFTRP